MLTSDQNVYTRWALIYTWLTGNPVPAHPSLDRRIFACAHGMCKPRHKLRLLEAGVLSRAVSYELESLIKSNKELVERTDFSSKEEVKKLFSYIISEFEGKQE